jgi:hypothetical protein
LQPSTKAILFILTLPRERASLCRQFLGARAGNIRGQQRYDGLVKGNWELSQEELALAEERLRHPTPGSKIEAAQLYGVDLTLLISQLRLTPAERVSRAQDAADAAESIRGAARRTKS